MTTTVTVSEGASGDKPWTFGLFSCCQNGCVDCLGKTICFECQWGKAMEIAFKDSCMVCCLGAAVCPGIMQIVSFFKRQSLREKYSLIGSTVNDFLSCWCCALCHYIQMIHEIEVQSGQTISCFGGATPARGGGAAAGVTVTTTVTSS